MEDKQESTGENMYIECVESEDSMDINHIELCPVNHFAIRMNVTGHQTVRKYFFVSLIILAEFNMKALMKTCHCAGQS